MNKKLKDTRLIAFIISFGGVTLIGLIVIAGLGLLSPPPSPTPVPSVAAISERVTVVPTPPSLSGATSAPLSPSAPVEPSPTPPQGSADQPRTESIEYTVRQGDTLFDIALAYQVSVEVIQAANGLAGETITPGQVLVIPSGPLPTLTPYVQDDVLIHTVSSGETLIGIAEHYSVTAEVIQVANDLDSEVIQPGWQLRIPMNGRTQVVAAGDTQAASATGSPLQAASVATSPANETGTTTWQLSILEGDLAAGYPLALERARFTLYYQPNTPAARAPNRMASLVESALDHIEEKLHLSLEDPFEVYVAGSFFGPDDLALRGRTFSSQRRSFLLYDDTGTPDERRYVTIHELTHMVAWNAIGRPSSVMLHEGLAVYTGVEAMEAAGFIPLTHFCAAYRQAGQLPGLAGERPYLGHIRDLDLYFTAGCFVQYLIETYGLEEFKQLFVDGDYPGIYGRTLGQLEAQWIETVDAVGAELTFNPDDLLVYVTVVADAYDRLFIDFSGTSAQMAAYRELDQGRIALLQGRFDELQGHLDVFEALLSSE